MSKSPNITEQIKGLSIHLELTPYGIAQHISAETDPTNRERMACEKRWQGYVKGQGLKQLQKLEGDLNALGYKITIEKQ